MNLFNGESIDLNTLRTRTDIRNSNKDIDQKYLKGDVRIVTEQARYPLNTIVSMFESGNYELRPSFQRRHRWDDERKSKLIESFIMNVPIPPIFLYEVKYSYYEVMDGLQRITTIFEFYKDKFCLVGLEEWPEINGFKYSQLPEQVKRGIDRRYLSSIILLQETAKNNEEATKMKQLVFERLNSGGVKLEPQETRNALYDGPLNQLCIKLARNKHLCKMWNIPNEEDELFLFENPDFEEELMDNDIYRKMEDVELVLRFFAYRQLDRMDPSSLKDYLDYYLQNGSAFSNEVLLNLEILFNDTVKLVYDIFGEKAFHLWRHRSGKWNWYRKPTKVVYDPLMYVIGQNILNINVLIENSERIRKDLTTFYEENYDAFEGRNTNKSNIFERINLFNHFISKYHEV